MDSLFEPTSYLESSPYDPSSFLTFSSFADLTATPPSVSDSWDDLFYSPPSSSYSSSSSFSPCSSFQTKSIPSSSLLRTAHSTSSDCSSPDLSFDPFEIGLSSFELTSPGIFHTPSKAGPSKLSAADVTPPALTHRVTGSIDSTWDSPLITPALGAPGGYVSPIQNSKSAFSWEDAPSTLATSSSYTPPTTAVSQAPLRVASNPSIGAHKNPRAIRAVTSMPALKEEVDTFQWFDGTMDDLPVTDEALVDNFDWVFGDYGLGGNLPMEGTIFAAFKENEGSDPKSNTPTTSTSTSTTVPSESTFSIPSSTSPVDSTDNHYNIENINLNTSWYGSSAQVAQADPATSPLILDYDFSQMFTIDPVVLGGDSRPASAPGAEGADSTGMLSAPAGQMTRSLSTPGSAPTRTAPTLESYYQPQQPPPHYAPQQVQQQQPAYAPTHGLPIRALPQRRASHNLTISVNHPTFSTYTPHADLPPMPHSAPFSSTSMSQAQSQAYAQSPYSSPQMYSHLQAPVAMARAGTQPIPTARRGSSSRPSTGNSSAMPAHLVRAQAIVQMQEAKEEAERQEHRRQAASRRVSMAESSVMQPLSTTTSRQPPPHMFPQATQPRAQPAITGWGVPSSLPSQSEMPSGTNGPLLNTQPLIVHPPPSYYSAPPQHTYHPQQHQSHPPPQHQAPPQPHRVHPPPHPGIGAGVGLGMGVPRPIARLPSSPVKGSRKVTSPKRSPSGVKAKRAPMQAGGFSWGEATFINFTPDDAEKLLTGVAPSGSQAKRRREEDAAKGPAVMSLGAAGGEFLAAGVDMDREGSKRSRSE